MRPHRVLLPLAAGSFLAALVLLALWPWLGLAAAYAAAGALLHGVVLLALGLRARRQAYDWAPPAPVPPVAMPADLAEADLAAIPEPVVACPHCASLAIRPLLLADGGLPGAAELSDKRACPRCGYQGLAVEFATRGDYADFLRDTDPHRADLR